MNSIIPWAFLLPLPGLVLTALGVPKRGGIASLLGPFAILAVSLVWLFSGHATSTVVLPNWTPFLPDDAFRLTIDGLSGTLLVVVGAVASCVYLYALDYMHDDARVHRFFVFLDIFVATMCLLLAAGNLAVLLIGWTGVGVSSFLLISFWWRKDGTLQAGYLALGANAIGDAALLIALVLVPKGAGELTHLADISGRVPGGAATLAILLVIAASAKSAQGPLFFWLPSAMAGPTPVSALIHAATMVAAGVYLLVRTSPLLAQAPDVMTLVAVLGTVTALGGGLASLWQSNFKRGLAYSTASQLGYMFAAVGVGAPFAATFHLVTHASFKAMLFLAAGIVIHATHEEELKKLGGLRKKLPVAHALFLIGSLAMIGFPFLAGAYSKDAILEHALEHSPTFGWILTAGALLTGLYTGRLFFGVFYGPEGEASQHYDGHHKPSALLQGPLVPLALGAIGLGYIGTDLHDVLASSVAGTYEFHAVTGFGLAVSGLGLLGFLVSGAFAVKKMSLPAPPANLTSALWDEFKVLPQAVSMVHNGQLGRYAMITLVGAGLMVFLGLRPVSAASLSTAQVKPRVGAESAPVKRRVVGPVAPSLVPVQPTLVPTGPVPSTTEPILHPTPVPATPDAKPIPPDAFKPSSLRAQFEAAQKAKAAQKAAEAAKAADAKPKKAPADAKGAKAKPKKTVGGAQ